MSPRQIMFRTLGLTINAVSLVSRRAAGQLAFRLFSAPPPPRVRPKERAFLATAERLDVDWNGYRLPVYAWGPAGGPVVFCAYGWGYNAGRWRHYVPALTEAGYRVVAFDPPGHGLAPRAQLDYPKMVDQQLLVLQKIGGCDLVLGHSFGGGCLVEALTRLPAELQPRRACMLAVFSEVKWIFQVFCDSLNLRAGIFGGMQHLIEQRTGRRLEEFDVAHNAQRLGHIGALIIHDPEDTVTAFRNARRNFSHWPNARLYAATGGGHHLGTAGVTRVVLDFLLRGEVPDGATYNDGTLEPLPATMTDADLAASGGVSDYYT